MTSEFFVMRLRIASARRYDLRSRNLFRAIVTDGAELHGNRFPGRAQEGEKRRESGARADGQRLSEERRTVCARKALRGLGQLFDLLTQKSPGGFPADRVSHAALLCLGIPSGRDVTNISRCLLQVFWGVQTEPFLFQGGVRSVRLHFGERFVDGFDEFGVALAHDHAHFGLADRLQAFDLFAE